MRLISELKRLAQALVERAERLVHQQHRRAEDERPRERDPLLLTAGELRRAARPPRSPQLHQLQRLARPAARAQRFGTLRCLSG